jgi:hypothetical protein
VGWLFALVFGALPRVSTLLLWRARPDLVAAAFGGRRLWPVLGIAFLPFATLLYVTRRSTAGVVGWDRLWLFLAVAIDISQASGSAVANRNRMSGDPGSTAASRAGPLPPGAQARRGRPHGH